MAKTQWVLLKVTVPNDASDPDILVPDVLDASFTEAGEGYAVELVSSGEGEICLETGIERRIYTDQGWEESSVDTGPGFGKWTPESAAQHVELYNRNRTDETGLPASRVVSRPVLPWEPV